MDAPAAQATAAASADTAAQPPPNKRRRKEDRRAAMAAAAAGLPVSASSYRWTDRNVFHAINEGRVPSDKLFDRPNWWAILDARPLAPGHALLVTKHRAATLLEGLPLEALADCLAELQVLVRAVQQATGCLGVQVKQNNGPAAGQTVPQLHFHVIPVNTPDDAAAAGQDQALPLTAAISSSSGDGAAAPADAQHQQQQQQQEQQQQRAPLSDEVAGPLLAALKNALPPSHSGPGVHAWLPTAEAMEALGGLLLSLCCPGTVLLLRGALGGGKTCIARGLVRAFTRDPSLFVPSPTFLLTLSYQEDVAGGGRKAGGAEGGGSSMAVEAAADAPQQQPEQQQPGQQQPDQPDQQQQRPPGRSVHHMDPYRLKNTDKMAGLIDFGSAFQSDVCVIEWPGRMPAAVMALPRRRTIEVTISGRGAQAAGRLVHIACSQDGAPGEAGLTADAAAAAAAGGAGGGGANGSTSSDAAAPPAAAAGEEQQQQPVTEQLAAWRAANALPAHTVAWHTSEEQAAAAAAAAGASLGQAGGGVAAGGVPPGDPASWLVLGIESSCDDTAAAVVRGDGMVLAHRIASQVGLHEQYGGVKPDVAQAAHAAAIAATVDGALADAGINPAELTAVAVTIGPGLSLCLQVGVKHALRIAAQHGKPWVPVHHMEAHALMAAMPGVLDSGPAAAGGPAGAVLDGGGNAATNSPPAPAAAAAAAAGSGGSSGSSGRMTFPALLLLVSGGHNMLVRCDGVGRHTVLGTTIDDSMGEAFDKVARLLGINAVPGGPHLERLAASAAPEDAATYAKRIPLPMRQDRVSCNFSFSGIKTSVGMLVAAERARLEAEGAPQEVQDRMAAAIASVFQDVSVRFLEERTERALQRCAADSAEAGAAPITCLVVSGGVAANSAVRGSLSDLAARYGLPLLAPPLRFCSDNGIMVAWTGLERLRLGLSRPPPPSLEHVDSAVEVLPRWPLGPVDVRGMTPANMRGCKMLHC